MLSICKPQLYNFYQECFSKQNAFAPTFGCSRVETFKYNIIKRNYQKVRYFE